MTGGEDGGPLAPLWEMIQAFEARDWAFYMTVGALLAGVYVLWVLD